MSHKPDFLRECMSDVPGVPIDDFNRSWCVVCSNSACSRSSANNHLFTRRAENWKEDLFLNVKRASDEDPKYASIRSKAFVSPIPSHEVVSQAASPEPGPKWFTPVNVEQEGTVEDEEDPPDTDPAPLPVMEPAHTLAPVHVSNPTVGQLASPPNTAFNQGMVLPGAQTKGPEVVMPPGQTYTFGDDE